MTAKHTERKRRVGPRDENVDRGVIEDLEYALCAASRKSVDARYIITRDVANTLAPTMPAVSPRWLAAMTRIGKAANVAIKASPWLMLFAISSPRDCGRSCNFKISTNYGIS